YIVFLVLVAIIGPHLVQNPDTFHPNLINTTFSRPYGPWGGIRLAHPLGVDLPFGRDMLSRVVNGAQVSLLIALPATALAVSHGVPAPPAPRLRPGGQPRRDHGDHRRLLRRLGRRGHRAVHGRLPRLPAAGVRDRAGRGGPVLGVRPGRQLAADRPAHLRDRVLLLALYGPDHPRPDAVPA